MSSPPASSLPASSLPAIITVINTPFVGGHWNSHEYSVGLNEFMDYSTEAMHDFDDHSLMKAVAEKIVWRLLKGRDLPISDTGHPFNLYADPSLTIQDSFRRLAHHLMSDFSQSAPHRSYVVSFFHSGGCNREWLEELMDEFDDWAERTTSPESDEQSPASSDSDDDSTIDLTQDSTPSSPSQVPSTSPFPMPPFAPMLLHSSLTAHVDEPSSAVV